MITIWINLHIRKLIISVLPISSDMLGLGVYDGGLWAPLRFAAGSSYKTLTLKLEGLDSSRVRAR